MSNIIGHFVALLLAFLMVGPASAAQATAAPSRSLNAFGEDTRLAYVLGANDQILIRVPEAAEITDKTFKIDNEGMVTLPLIGPVKAVGLTVQQFEAELATKLSAYYRSPQVSVTVLQYRSDIVYFVGAFQKPGIYPLQGQHRLTEMLAVVGGLLPNASFQLTVTRRLEQGRIAVINAVEDRERGTSVAEIKLTRSLSTAYPEDDIVLRPNDVIRATLGQEDVVYIQGAKSGAVPLGEKSSLSVLQVISLAGGLPPDAKLDKAVVLRPVMDTTRRAELPLNLKKIMAGKANDLPLLANDVLVIPQSHPNVMSRVLWIAAPAAVTSLIIYGVQR